MFLSCTTHNIDSKGRVSVPAEFRAEIAGTGFEGIIVWPSLTGPCLEGGSLRHLQDLQKSLDMMDYFDEGRQAMQQVFFGQSRRLAFDGAGRVTMPKDVAALADITDKAMFVGIGRNFEIWNPDDYEARAEDFKALAMEHRSRLRAPRADEA